MTKRELMDMLENIAKDYVKTAKISLERNSHMHQATIFDILYLKQNQIDAIIADFINVVGTFQGLDEGFYVKNLYEN